jgi:Leucine-rich repeat (LRR) protein
MCETTLLIASYKKITNNDIKHLTNLTSVFIRQTNITDEGSIGESLINLTKLDASETKITNKYSEGKLMNNLITLDISWTKITNNGVKQQNTVLVFNLKNFVFHVKHLMNLTSLKIRQTRITDEGSKGKYLINLTELDASETNITGEGSKGKMFKQIGKTKC